MNSVEILKDFFFIERGYLNGNHFVYKGSSPVLIDTAYIADFSETENLINDLGVKLFDIQLIVSTHTHCDHIGGNKFIQEKSGCDIALHKIGKYFIDTYDDWSTWWKYYQQDAEFFNCTQALEDGDTLTIGPYDFQVIYTPGHASDGIVLYNRKEKLLLSSDTLWENEMAVLTARVEGSTAIFKWQESIEKIESLEVSIVYPGHGSPFIAFNEAISKTKSKIKEYLEHREKIGLDLLKKIIVYTLLMRKTVSEALFFSKLMEADWFRETIDFYFDGDYQTLYDTIMHEFIERGIVKRKTGRIFTTVRP